MLELDKTAMSDLMERVLDHSLTHLDTLESQPASVRDPVLGAALASKLREGAPEEGSPAEEILQLLFNEAIPCSYNTASPGYMAYVPGGGLPHSALADFIANITNRYVGIWPAAPGLVQIETNVIRWFCDMVEFPPESLGFLTTGGSMANFSALVAARTHVLPENFLSGKIYVSEQVHHSMTKAAMIAGFPKSSIRVVPTNDDFQLIPEALEQAIVQDRQQGAQPCMVVGSAGTTNTGAIDPLNAIADIAERENIWFHIDGAYGGFFCLTETGKHKLNGLSRADSITLDPHKGLFLPYGTGALLVRDRQHLTDAFDAHAAYLPPFEEHPDHVDYCRLSPELSRDFRGLRVWLPIKLEGLSAFRSALNEKLELAQWVYQAIDDHPKLEVVAAPQLSTVVFKLKASTDDTHENNQRNQELLEEINAPGTVYLTGTTLGEDFVLRVCILSFRTHKAHVQAALEAICRAVEIISSRIPTHA